MKNTIETMYLDYVNNFLSIEAFAEYYFLDMNQANRVIEIGRKIDHGR